MMDRGRRAFLLSLAVIAVLVCAWWALQTKDAPVAPPQSAVSTQPTTPPVAEVANQESAPPAETPSRAFATLRGRVVDAATREPVREFELRFAEWGRAQPDHDVPAAQKFSSEDGQFEWQGLPPGQWGLIAEAAGYQRFLTDMKLTSGDATTELLVPLVRGYALRGRVFDEASGTGIVQASISFRMAGQHPYEGNWRLRPSTQSRKDGSFVLNGIPPGRITLAVGANSYASREIDIAVGDDVAPLEVGLSSGGVVAGRLTAADGATPVAGHAGLFRIDGGYSGENGGTNEAGEFSFRNLKPGVYRLTARGPGGTAIRELSLAENERIEGLVLALRGGRTIRGTVTGLRPAELKSLDISVQSAEGSGSLSINERGEYELRDVQPGRVQVAADVSMRRQLVRTVDVPPDADVTLDFDFPRGSRVSGRVTQRGRPVAGAWLEPRPVVASDFFFYGARTSETGHYVMEDLPSGEYTIRIDGYTSRPFEVAGDTVFDIDASPQLAGRILEDNGKVAIADAELYLWPNDPTSSRARATDRSDHFGRFAVAGLEPGDFVLTVFKPGYGMFRERIPYASPIHDMTIRLERDAGVELRAHDAASGKPLQQLFMAEMIGDRNGFRQSLALDEKGVGYIPGALAGATLSFGTEGYTMQTVSRWNGARLDLKFMRAAAQ